MRSLAALLIILAASSQAFAAAPPPLRLSSGQALVCAYFFGHWWDPWRSDDQAVRRDLRSLRELGVNAICVDHEPSQSIDGDWKWLEREHRMAKEAGLAIIPWLELKCGADMSGHHAEVEKRYGIRVPRGETQDGKPSNTLIHRPEYARILSAYVFDYLDHFLRDGALLRVKWGNKLRPVVSLTVETGWDGTSFDDETNALFRSWLRKRYRTIARVNKAWGSSYESFDQLNPCDQQQFPYAEVGKHPEHKLVAQSVKDHTLFRAELISQALGRVKQMVRKRHPDLLFLAEVPYTFGSDHPHAVGHTYSAAMLPEAVAYADIVMFRTVGNSFTPPEQAACRKLLAQGKAVILSHRTYEAKSFTYLDAAQIIAGQAASFANGLGYYSWNEMGDTHITQRADSEEMMAAITTINRRYQELCGK